jgi:hypothetical protein
MEVDEVKEVEEAEEDRAAGAESRLARYVTNFGTAAGRYYTPERIQSEEKTTQKSHGWLDGQSRPLQLRCSFRISSHSKNLHPVKRTIFHGEAATEIGSREALGLNRRSGLYRCWTGPKMRFPFQLF